MGAPARTVPVLPARRPARRAVPRRRPATSRPGGSQPSRLRLIRGTARAGMELHGGASGGVAPDKPIKAAIDGVPLGTARYQVSLSDDHKSIDRKSVV